MYAFLAFSLSLFLSHSHNRTHPTTKHGLFHFNFHLSTSGVVLNKMATWSRSRYLILSAFGFIAVGFLFNIIAFSTPNWLEADDRYKLTNGFVKVGLQTGVHR